MMTLPQNTKIKDLPLNRDVHVVASNDDGLVALEKPDNIMSHPNKSDDIKRSLLTVSYDYEGEFYFWEDDQGNEQKVWLINRLDSPTSGLILIGLNPEITAEIKIMFATHRVQKTYYALVRHHLKNKTGSWSDMISKDLVNGRRVIKGGRKIEAKTTFQCIAKPTGGFPVSLVKLMPITGRTHQLRVQCKKHGHPIVGDRTYGSFSFNKEVTMETGEKRMMLHSGETKVNYSFKGKVRTFHAKSELPEAFNTVIRFRPGMRTLKAASEEEKKSVLEGRRFKEV
ncbi:MAG: RluA family pseudouridine synthase [Verrucomicrobiota bacterium]